MNKYYPPIASRETEELIVIANCGNTELWQKDAIEQAKNELIKRGVSAEDQENVLKSWDNQFKQQKILYEKQLQTNTTIGYSLIDLLKYLVFAPFFILGILPTEYSLFELRKNNFKKRFFLRILMYVLGVALFLFVIEYSYKVEEEQRIEEIENVDISDWENNRIENKNDTTK